MMSPSVVRRLEWMLIALLVATHVWLYVLGFMDRPQSQWWATLSDALRIAQPALLTIFTLLGLRPRWWPIGGALLGGWYGVLQIVPDERFGLPTIVVTEVACLAAVLLVVRWCGLAIRKVDFGEPPGPRWRFSIRTLVIVTAMAAVAVRGSMTLRDWISNQNEFTYSFVLVNFGVTSAMIALMVLFLTMPPGRVWWRVWAVIPFSVLLGAIPLLLVGHETWDLVVLGTWCLDFALVDTATMLILRLCGYRLCYQIAPAVSQSPLAHSNHSLAETPAAITAAM